jgi:hypothetical protein
MHKQGKSIQPCISFKTNTEGPEKEKKNVDLNERNQQRRRATKNPQVKYQTEKNIYIYIQFKLASHTQSFNVLRIALNHNNSYFTINLIHKSKV